MIRPLISVVGPLLLSGAILGAEGPAKVLFETNFDNAPIGKLPEGFLVLEGDFTVQEFEGKKVCELPGEPLDSFGLLFGPSTGAGACVAARIYGLSKGRRYPAFGVGLNGVGGYKLKVSPGKGALEIYKGDALLASVPFDWKSGSWTAMRLETRAEGGQSWKILGKAWPQSAPEPKDWMVWAEDKAPPGNGRASLWASPYSGKPIRFTDLLLTGP
jgi:hypothetical protein